MTPADRLAEAVREHLDWGPKTQSDRHLLDKGMEKALAEYRSAPPVDVEKCANVPELLSLGVSWLERLDIARAVLREAGVME